MDRKNAGAAIASRASSIQLNVKQPTDCSVVERDFDTHLSKSVSIDDFEQRIIWLLRCLGIDRWSHINANSVVDGLDVFGVWPAELIKHYLKEEFYRDDLIIRHAMVSDKPIFTHQMCAYLSLAPIEFDSFPRNLEFNKEAQKCGIKTALAIPVVRPKHRAIFTVSATQSDIASFEANMTRNLPVLQALAHAVDHVGHMQFSRAFHGKQLKSSIGIDPKHLKLLDTLATKDLTLDEAAAVLDLSISAANVQIAAAKKSLGASTTHGAIMTALKKGFIDLHT